MIVIGLIVFTGIVYMIGARYYGKKFEGNIK